MGNFLKTRGIDLAITAIAISALMVEPAWATTVPILPGVGAGGLLAGGAIIGALVIARWWRQN